ncbi:predicted protein [Uncinocarpus reesii 1704]|uniref:HTH La-type RNA-binding domain-containing protein n=1 Tax=Uncinocarpus reesii (strain UAMH 1704) TaxID=336963 RepID=C4JQY0_UNCRE|nr:uncharacterized protein UREG_03462 [Uncinocarpus reesii 1704]EEP78616.1 predicted protein [Uncinocarpus reesii 1704]
MPTFSYAQAAKGLVSSTPAQSNAEKQSKPASPSNGQMLDDVPSHESNATMTQLSSKEQMDPLGNRKLPTENESNKGIPSGASSPSVATASTETLPKEDDMSLTPNGSSDSTWDKQSERSVSVSKSNQAPEGGAEETAENGTKNVTNLKDLKPASIPAVNIWQKRLEAQEAKAKANAAMKSTSPSSKAVPSKTPATQSGSESRPESSKSNSRRKSSESFLDKKKPGDAPKKGSARGHRVAPESDSTEPLPPVGDAASWPTPQLAQGQEHLRAQEKIDRAERVDRAKPVSSRSHGKEKWMPVPYVPTAVFTTPLPPAARRGGRAARGGRESSASHTHGHNVDSERQNSGSSRAGNSKHPPVTDRRTASDSKPVPGAKSNGISTSFDERHSSLNEGRASGSKDTEETYVAKENHSQINGAEPQYRPDFKSFTKSQDQLNGPVSQASRQGAHHGEGQPRYSQSTERRFESGPRSADPFRESNSFTARDRELGRDRDYQRGDLHREREYSREHRGEPRSERGRGSYRGRGGHSTYGTQNTPFHSAPLAQHPFSTPKNFSFNNERHRMQPGGAQNGSQGNGRVGLRSPSINPAVYASAPYPLQTDFTSMYGYPQMPQAPMTAVPYQPYMEQYSLMSMISMQLEYYFSVDNLCKDLFLRRHMDSQGFVLLSVIAAFKRIKSLTEDLELLRLVCRQLKNVEFRPGEDGLDRIRKRDKWEQWVLSMDMRDPSAQNEGPPPATTLSSTNFDSLNENGITTQQDGLSNITNGPAHATASTSPPTDPLSSDALNNHVPARSAKLSSTAAEFSPLAPSATSSEHVSEENPVSENTFPDEQVGNLVIVVRKPGIPDPTQSPVHRPPSRSFSNGFVDGYKAAHGQLSAGNRSSFVPHGILPASERSAIHPTPFTMAAVLIESSADLDQRRRAAGLTNSSLVKSSVQVGGQTPSFWIKSKNNTPIESLSTDLVHESYTIFRKQALDKRLSDSSSETPVDMDVLYQFWSHFLVRNFNSRMYDEFRSLAFDDISSRNSSTGLQYLIKFYAGILSSDKVIPDGIARDLVSLVQSEMNTNEKPTFGQLRRAWRDGAFNLKSRKKVDGLLDESLRAELER